MQNNKLIIGISGGTGSGKTKFTKELIKRCDSDNIVHISQDSYYKDLSHISYEERCNINFDNPSSINFNELKNDIQNLINDKTTNIPVYSFKRHKRLNETRRIDPKPIIIIEGIFVFHDPKIRDLINCKVFVDTPADIRILRRAKRDINKRDRSIESIFSQYINTVKPMHEKFIEPTINYADIIVKDGGKNPMAIEVINSKLIPMIKSKING
tara:strand:+ start:1809 stop:2444 length:636 start_codon:yes stop_codon:yes gene_type:complete